MRLGGPVFPDQMTPEAWAEALKTKQYHAAYCPLTPAATATERAEYRAAAAEGDVVIAEVGAWSNPLSPDPKEADAAYRKIVESIRLADDVGARCCVNIAGSRGAKWDGPDSRDLTEETFDAIVGLVQRILAEAGPEHASYALEPMPWMYPDSAESYDRILRAVDHPRFAVHYDPVNLVSSPRKYFTTGSEIHDFVSLLGGRIVSVHAKDIILRDRLTTHLDECVPGEGGLDYETLLRELDRLDPALPVMTEHLTNEHDYDCAAQHIRSVADRLGIDLSGRK